MLLKKVKTMPLVMKFVFHDFYNEKDNLETQPKYL